MKKELMMQQEQKILNFWKKEPKERLGLIPTATKFTIDSVIEDRVRLLVSELRRRISITRKMLDKPSGELGKKLANFKLWKEVEDGDQIISLEEAAQKLGVKKSMLKEGKVFVNFENKTFEISEFVRQETKNHYLDLLKREYHYKKQKEKAQ